MADTFNEIDKQTSGIYANDYLWSDVKNWSTGALPVSTDAVTLNFAKSAPAVVDLALTVASVTLGSSGSLIVANALTTATLSGIGAVSTRAGGTLEITGSISNSEIFVLDGGALKLGASVVLASGSALTFGATATYGASAVYVADLANFNQTNFFACPINSMDIGDSLQFGTLKFVSATYNSNGHTLLMLTSTNASYDVTNLRTSIPNAGFGLSTAANGGSILTLNCFLAGTRIETPGGPVAIETLSIGDLVVTIENGCDTATPVQWIGTRYVDPGAMDAELAREAAPVRIRAHALADNMPVRDLLVTADHCIFVEGGLTPARMLVNGASIVRETDGRGYRVYHIECATHSILLSEGLATESYLDSGLRGAFGLPDARAHPGVRSPQDAAAPLVTAQARVEPIWRRLAARAGTLGLGPSRDGGIAGTTADPALRLRLDDGTLLRARRCRGRRHFFVLPARSTNVTLQSRSAIPAEVEGVFVDDRRRLGVLVRRVTLWTDLHSTEVEPGANAAAGWYRPEPSGDGRWTNGEAGLPMPGLPQPTILEIELAGTLRYPTDDGLQQRRQA